MVRAWSMDTLYSCNTILVWNGLIPSVPFTGYTLPSTDALYEPWMVNGYIVFM